MNCEKCAYYDEDRNNQPCCSCDGQNFELKKECTDCKSFVGCSKVVFGCVCDMFVGEDCGA